MTSKGPQSFSDVLATPGAGDELHRIVAKLRQAQAAQLKEEGLTEPRRAKPVQPTVRVAETDSSKPTALAETPKRSPARRDAAAAFDEATTAPRSQKKKVLVRSGELNLPYWPEDRRGISNDIARCALFTVRQKEARDQIKGGLIASLKNLEILYTGEELRQRDEDVFLQILHFGRLVTLGAPISFSGADMLRALGWARSHRSRTELHDSIVRMTANALHLVARSESRERGYSGSLIRDAAYDRKPGTGDILWTVSFDPRIIRLFSHTEYTQIDWNQRRQLTPIAKWLHAFYFTHQQPFSMKVETIRGLCGSTASTLTGFRHHLRAALSDLVKVGFLSSWEIGSTSDLVSVVRVPLTKQVIEPDRA